MRALPVRFWAPDVALSFAEQEKQTYWKWFLQSLDHRSNWWFRPSDLENGQNKFRQLQVAREVGLNVPSTKIAFGPSSVPRPKDIVKSLTSGTLDASTDVTYSFPTIPGAEFEAIRGSKELDVPLIFQEQISSAVDVRILAFEDDLVCTAMTKRDTDQIDWRFVKPSKVSLEKIEAPYDTRSKVFAFMKKANVKAACLDFLVDKQNAWWFLEANLIGQWALFESVHGNWFSKELCKRLLSPR